MSALPEFDFAAGTALVTGAASGIGEQLAHGLAARGTALVLLDRDAEGLAAVAADVRAAHPTLAVDTLVVDLADRAGLGEVAHQLAADHPGLTLLVNNAGVALGGRFDQVTLEEFDWVMDVNFHAPVALTHALLPTLKSHPGSHLVNVSSIFGIIGPAGQSAYSSSKFALRGFSEVLRAELAEDAVGVTVVHPGGIRTSIARSARIGAHVPETETQEEIDAFDRLLSYPADRAAEQILEGVRRRRGRVLIASSATVPDLLARAMPGSYTRALDGLSALARRFG